MAFLCEDVKEDPTDGVLSFTRAVDTVSVTAEGETAPANIPPGQQVTLFFVIQLHAGSIRGAHRLSLELERPTGGIRPGNPELAFSSVDRDESGHTFVVKVVISDVERGLYWF